MIKILEPILSVITKSKYVTINQAAIAKFSSQVQVSDLRQIHLLKAMIDWGFTSEELIAFVIILEALNFSYWGEPKWTVKIDGQEYDGFYAMFYSLKQAKDKGYPILTPDYLANLSVNNLKSIWQGNTLIPLFNERWQILRDLGKTVTEKFDGRFRQIIERGLWDAEQIVSILGQDFPAIFNDVAEYQGQTVQFFKRAQLVPAHLLEFQELGLLANKVTNIDKLTAFADYKVPQALRKLGILEYTEDLANKVDNLTEISSSSEEEIEIRANTIWAVDLLTQALKEKFPAINSAKVDELIWLKGQFKSPNDKPYHRCRTIWY
jgi:hypothetical protein